MISTQNRHFTRLVSPSAPVFPFCESTLHSNFDPFHLQGLTRALVAYNMEFLLQVRNRPAVNDAAQHNAED